MPSGNVSAMAEEFVDTIVSLMFPLMTITFIVIFVGMILGWTGQIDGGSSSSSSDDEDEEDKEDDEATKTVRGWYEGKTAKPTIQSPKASDYDFPEVKRSGGRNGLLVAILAIAAIVVLFFIFR